MKRRMVVKGPEVQDVGYRGFLLDAARDFEIEGFSARNLRLEGAVEVLVKGPPENVERFVDFAQTNIPETARVERVDVEECEAEIPGIVEFAEQFSAFQVPKIVSIGGNILTNQDEMLEKQDETIQTIREESGKTRETVREESSKTRSTLEEGFTGQRKAHVETRELSKEVFYAEVEELRNEIRDLRSALDEVRSEIGLA